MNHLTECVCLSRMCVCEKHLVCRGQSRDIYLIANLCFEKHGQLLHDREIPTLTPDVNIFHIAMPSLPMLMEQVIVECPQNYLPDWGLPLCQGGM